EGPARKCLIAIFRWASGPYIIPPGARMYPHRAASARPPKKQLNSCGRRTATSTIVKSASVSPGISELSERAERGPQGRPARSWPTAKKNFRSLRLFIGNAQWVRYPAHERNRLKALLKSIAPAAQHNYGFRRRVAVAPSEKGITPANRLWQPVPGPVEIDCSCFAIVRAVDRCPRPLVFGNRIAYSGNLRH